VDKRRIIEELRAEIARLTNEAEQLRAIVLQLENISDLPSRFNADFSGLRKERGAVSQKGREAIARAQRLRWQKVKASKSSRKYQADVRGDGRTA